MPREKQSRWRFFCRGCYFWATFGIFLLLAGIPDFAAGQVPRHRPDPNFPGSEPIGRAFSGFLGFMLLAAGFFFVLGLFLLVKNVRQKREGGLTGPAWMIGGSVLLVFGILTYAQFLNGAVAWLNT